MGCGLSHESVVQEMKSIMVSMKEENQQLEEIRDNLKLQQELTSSGGFTVPTLTDLVTNSTTLEALLKEAKKYGVTFLPPNSPDLQQNSVIISTISIQNELEDKNEKIYRLKNDIFTVNTECEVIKKEIGEYETQIKQVGLPIEYNGENEAETKYFIIKMNQLEDCKQELVAEVTNLEQDCKDVSDQIVALETQESNEKTGAMTFESLLTMSEEEIKNESVKLDKEIKELTDNLKKLKEKELEIEEMSNYVMGLKMTVSPKNQNLRMQARESANRVNHLEKEREKLLQEIESLKKGKQRLGSEKKIPFSEERYERNHSGESEEYSRKLNLNMNIEETLRRARELASSLKPRNTL